MEKLSFEFEIKGVTKSINSIAEAKDALSELQDVVENSDFGSEEFRSASAEIDKVQAKLIEATSKGVEPATNGFKKLKDELKAAKNAQAEAAQTFGEGSKEYKAAAQQVANLQDKLDDLKDSSVSLKGTGIERLNSGVGLLKEGFANFDTDKLKVGFNALGSAMKAIPIFLIIEGLRLLYENFDKVSAFAKKFFDLQTDAEKEVIKLNKQIKEQEELTKALAGSLQREIELMEAQGASTDMILKKKKELALAQLRELELQGRLSVAKIAEIEQNDSLAESAQRVLVATLKAQGNAQAAELIEKQISQSKKERMAEELKAFNETNEKIKNIGNSLRVEEAKIETKKREEGKKIREEKKKQADEDFQAALKQQTDEEELRTKRLQEEAANRARILEEMKAIEFKVMQEENAAQLEAWAKEDEARKKDVEAHQAAEAQKSALTLQGLQTISQLTDAFAGKSEESQKRAFQIKKAASIAQATIETYQAAQSSYASQMTIPTPDAPVRAAVAAGLAIAQGLARVAIIARTKFNTTGESGGGSGGSTPAVGGSAPAFNSIAPSVNPANQQPQTTRLDENGRPIGQNTSFRIKADVVEKDMTEKQKEQEKRKSLITF